MTQSGDPKSHVARARAAFERSVAAAHMTSAAARRWRHEKIPQKHS